MAVNRYFDRTLMPYNPIERPMPFDKLLQAGAMKQAAVDNLLTAADEFQAQKQLTGGRSTTQIASELNDQYVGKAAEIQTGLMTGAMTPDQAARELRSVNRDYSKDQYVKAVLMDQTLTPLAAKTEADEKFIAGLGESEYWDYENKNWKQITRDDINQGYQLDGSRYGLVTQPGFYADHAQELSDLVANSYASRGIDIGSFDMNTGAVYNKEGKKVETLSRDKIDRLIWDFTHRQPIEDSDKMSVKYEMMKAKRLGQEFDEDGYYNKLSQAAAMMPFIREQESQDLGRIGGTGSKGGSSDQKGMMDAVYGWASVVTEQGSNALRKYGVNEENSMEMFKDMGKLLSDEGQNESLNQELNENDIALKPGSDYNNPEYVYASSIKYSSAGLPVSWVDVTDPADIRLAEISTIAHKTDMQFFKNVTENIEKEFEQKYNMNYSDFMANVETNYLPQITEKIKDYTDPTSFKTVEGQGSRTEQVEDFKQKMEEAVPGLSNTEYLSGVNADYTGIDFKVLFPDWDPAAFADGTGFKTGPYAQIKNAKDRQKAFIKDKLIERGISEEEALAFATENVAELGGTGLLGKAGAGDELRSMTSVPLSMVAKFNTDEGRAVNDILFDKYGDTAALEVLKREDRGAYDMYMETRTQFSERIKAFNEHKSGLKLDPETNEVHKTFANAIMGSIDNRATRETKPFSGEKSGAYFKDVLPEGVVAKDYRPSQLYIDRDEDGNWAWYATMQYWPSGSSTTETAMNLNKLVQEEGKSLIDIKVDDLTAGIIPSDAKGLATTIETFRSQIYSLGANEPFDIELPSEVGPHLKLNATKQAAGIKIEGDVYVRDGGEIKKMDVMEAYRREQADKGNYIPEGESVFKDAETAALYASKMVQSHANLTQNYSFLYDKNGEFQGADVPDDVNERFDQARSALTDNATAAKLKAALPNLFGEDDASNEQEMQRLVNTMIKIMDFETGGQLTPYVSNPDKSAIGLIQFYQDPNTPLTKTIGGKQYTFTELGRMSIAEQIQGPVIEYLAEVGKNKVSTPEELYLAVFMPALLDYSENSTRKDVDISKMNYDTPLVGIGQDLVNRGRIKPGFWASVMAKNPAFQGKRTINDILNTVRQYGANRM
jgi:hypothetical protein